VEKKLILFLIIVNFLTLLIKQVYADTNVSIDVETPENVNLDVDINSTGNVGVVIDGTNINEEITGLNNTMNDMYQDVYGISPHSIDGFLIGAESVTDVSMSSYCSTLSAQFLQLDSKIK
jgi:hypothetical protein